METVLKEHLSHDCHSLLHGVLERCITPSRFPKNTYVILKPFLVAKNCAICITSDLNSMEFSGSLFVSDEE